MMLLNYIYSPIARAFAAVGGALLFVWYVYSKGASAARAKMESRSRKEAQDAIDKANKARNDSNVKSDRGRSEEHTS